MKRRLILFCFFSVTVAAVFAQTRGEEISADIAVKAAEKAIASGDWARALDGLEAAAEYRNASSDLSYLLALARRHEGKPSGAVLEALDWADACGLWKDYSEEDCGLLKARVLIGVRDFPAALDSLDHVGASADEAELRLLIYKGIGLDLGDLRSFRSFLKHCFDRYPRDPRPVRILFEYLHTSYLKLRPPSETPFPGGDGVVELAVKRLPYVLDMDDDLAWLAAPLLSDQDQARRILQAGRAKGRPLPATIPAALRFGLINDDEALDELFAPRSDGVTVIPYDLLVSCYNELGTEGGRNRYHQIISEFSGVLTVDRNRDDIPESAARYRDGFLFSFTYDEDQDGLAELSVGFGGLDAPANARTAALPERVVVNVPPYLPRSEADRNMIDIEWEKYPALLHARSGNIMFDFSPEGFLYKPVDFEKILGADSLLPVVQDRLPRLGLKSLSSAAVMIRRPSLEFSGGEERIGMEGGVPIFASERLNGRQVSTMSFKAGLPAEQKLDLDLDGRMETRRVFRDGKVVYTESDWDGDGLCETAEEYTADSVLRSWDLNADGIREYQ